MTGAPNMEPDQTNLYKLHLQQARSRVEVALGTLGAGGVPTRKASTAINGGGWISSVADAFVAELDGKGAAARNAFANLGEELSREIGGQPDLVPADDWRARPYLGRRH
jgi:hypothetical protein